MERKEFCDDCGNILQYLFTPKLQLQCVACNKHYENITGNYPKNTRVTTILIGGERYDQTDIHKSRTVANRPEICTDCGVNMKIVEERRGATLTFNLRCPGCNKNIELSQYQD